jgi:predicted protein tyrosine phosphatase
MKTSSSISASGNAIREGSEMEIRICGYLSASWLLEQEPKQWHALVMLDSLTKPTSFVESHALSHLYLHFDDINTPQAGKQVPTSLLVERGLEFGQAKEKLLVVCRAGQSRSAAMAYLICCQQQGSVQAVQVLNPTRHSPNRRVIEIGDALLGDLDILDQFEKWRERHHLINLSDYYDEMEKEFDALTAQGAQNKIISS